MKAKLFKVVFMVLRGSSRPIVGYHRFAFHLYYWSDLHLYQLGRVYVLPAWVYRCLTCLCNAVSSINTTDQYKLRFKAVGRFIDWVVHRVPDEIRFS